MVAIIPLVHDKIDNIYAKYDFDDLDRVKASVNSGFTEGVLEYVYYNILSKLSCNSCITAL